MSKEEWTIDHSRRVYGLGRGDLHFLDITEEGDLCIRLRGQVITFREIASRLEASNGHSPSYTSSFTLRIPELTAHQIAKIRACFERAMKDLEYKGRFLAVYPIKVNQRRDCVIPVVMADREYGLEVGTKAELELIKAVIQKERDRQIVCNGAKDPSYLDLILQCTEEGYNVSVSIESVHEARMIVDTFDPRKTDLILRIKPYLSVEGHWSHSTGRDSKFGLSIHDLYHVLELLEKRGFTSTVRTILAHAGSQITDIDAFRRFGHFMTDLYVELREKGLEELEVIDFGGGLAIDYEGSLSEDHTYQYAASIIEGVKEGLAVRKVNTPPPDIMIESGRCVTALSSLVVVRALETRSVFPSEGDLSRFTSAPKSWLQKEERLLERIRAARRTDDFVQISNELHHEFGGRLSDTESILISECIVGRLERAIRRRLRELRLTAFDSEKLERDFWYPEHIVIGNFSVFNSIADHVLVKQHFPVIPLQDLHLRPETTARLVDITCDSDGEIAQFYRQNTDVPWYSEDDRPVTVPGGGMGLGIPVGKLDRIPDAGFLLALTGAYQDVIEMDHNLLGDLPDVELHLHEDNRWSLHWITGAQSIRNILDDLGYLDLGSDWDPYMD